MLSRDEIPVDIQQAFYDDEINRLQEIVSEEYAKLLALEDVEKLGKQYAEQQIKHGQAEAKLTALRNTPFQITANSASFFKAAPLLAQVHVQQFNAIKNEITNLLILLRFDHMPFSLAKDFKQLPLKKGPVNSAMAEVLRAANSALDKNNLSILQESIKNHKNNFDRVSTHLEGDQALMSGNPELLAAAEHQPAWHVWQVLQKVFGAFNQELLVGSPIAHTMSINKR